MCQAPVGEAPKAKLLTCTTTWSHQSVLSYLSWQGQTQAPGSGGSRNRAGALWFPTSGAGALPSRGAEPCREGGVLEGQPWSLQTPACHWPKRAKSLCPHLQGVDTHFYQHCRETAQCSIPSIPHEAGQQMWHPRRQQWCLDQAGGGGGEQWAAEGGPLREHRLQVKRSCVGIREWQMLKEFRVWSQECCGLGTRMLSMTSCQCVSLPNRKVLELNRPWIPYIYTHICVRVYICL